MNTRFITRFATLATVAISLVMSACARDASEPSTLESPAAALAPGTHGLVVRVRDAQSNPAGGILVTATNISTGAFDLSFTGPKGVADFNLPAGNYLVHARNLADAGPSINPFPQPLVIAPLPQNAALISTGATQGINREGVLYDPAAANTSVPLDPANYSRLTANPPLVLSGPSSTHSVSIQFGAGSVLDCTFIGPNGQPLTLPTTENVFVILPHGTGPLPPLPPYAIGQTLPRGILLGVTTAPAGASSCALAGFGGAAAIVETNPVPIGNTNQVLVGQTGAPGTVVPLVAEPIRSQIGYLLDPTGDNTGREDIGLSTFGWEMGPTSITDNFVVATRFRGAGNYLVELQWSQPTPSEFTAIVRCDDTGCRLTGVEPAAWAGQVRISAAVQTAGDFPSGTIQFAFTIPGVNALTFRVFGGGIPRSDISPNTGSQSAVKTGTGNTWLIPGD
jgi:hypothetical protein